MSPRGIRAEAEARCEELPGNPDLCASGKDILTIFDAAIGMQDLLEGILAQPRGRQKPARDWIESELRRLDFFVEALVEKAVASKPAADDAYWQAQVVLRGRMRLGAAPAEIATLAVRFAAPITN